MLILDEPTSAVDSRTEQLIMEALDTLMAHRTTFMIAHRLSTLERCDAVLVLKNGALETIANTVDEARKHMALVSLPVEFPSPRPVLLHYEK